MIVLDTCAVLWDALDPVALTEQARDRIRLAERQSRLAVSDITLWEIAMLAHKERIRIEVPVSRFINLFLQSRSAQVLPITPDIAELATRFRTDIGGDPADTLIAATTVVHNARLVTADRRLLQNEVIDTVW